MGVFQIRVKVEKNPELGFSISGGVGGRGNPFRPDDNVNLSFFFLYSTILKRHYILIFVIFSQIVCFPKLYCTST